MVLGLIRILGMVIFIYLVWRNLFDDYRDDLLISYAWGSLLVLLASGRLVYGLWNWGVFNNRLFDWFQIWNPDQFSIFGGIIGVLLWTWWYCVINQWKLWSILEDLTPIYYILIAFFLAETMVNSNYTLESIINLGIALTGYLLSNFMMGRYRSISWYKSGKKGFGFFFTNIVVGMVLAGLTAVNRDWWQTAAYSIISLIFGLGLVILGELYVTKK